MIKHIWFDFSETIGRIDKEAHKNLRYETYANIVHKPVTPELVTEYENLYEKHNHSNSSVFKSLGMGISDLALGTEIYRQAVASDAGHPFSHPKKMAPRLRSNRGQNQTIGA